MKTRVSPKCFVNDCRFKNLFKKGRHRRVLFCKFCKTFRIFFIRHLQGTASVCSNLFWFKKKHWNKVKHWVEISQWAPAKMEITFNNLNLRIIDGIRCSNIIFILINYGHMSGSLIFLVYKLSDWVKLSFITLQSSSAFEFPQLSEKVKSARMNSMAYFYIALKLFYLSLYIFFILRFKRLTSYSLEICESLST